MSPQDEARIRALERANRELMEFAYVASHDLQEPLRMVASHVRVLADKYRGQLDEQADQHIHFAVDGCERMQRLILDLLDYSQVMRKVHDFADVDLTLVVREVISNLEVLIRESGALLEYEGLPVVVGDRRQLLQLLQNLISNAVKFVKDERPHVIVSATEEAGGWNVFVKDNGIGIDEKYQDRVFRPFRRLHGRDAFPGSGVGLALAQKIVERHGGTIWFESSVGVGTTFAFFLPFDPKDNSVIGMLSDDEL